ncbi:hypothetical protein [Vibrio rotiferianus]|uniref:hypothetical protein n=1 Tax=Vibrio rotiferianus TaxID=190895 RepID=UPI00390AF1E6
MLQILKKSENWVEGTVIHHDWDKQNHNVNFYFDFPNSNDADKDSVWEHEVKSVIAQFPRK